MKETKKLIKYNLFLLSHTSDLFAYRRKKVLLDTHAITLKLNPCAKSRIHCISVVSDDKPKTRNVPSECIFSR